LDPKFSPKKSTSKFPAISAIKLVFAETRFHEFKARNIGAKNMMMSKLSEQKEKRSRNVHQKRYNSWYAFIKYLIQQPRRSWVWSVRPAGTEDARFRGDPQGTANSRWARDLVALNAMPEFHENALSLKTLQGMAGLLHDVLTRITAAKPEPPIAPVRAAGVEDAYLALCVSTTQDLDAPRGLYALDYLVTGGAQLELVSFGIKGPAALALGNSATQLSHLRQLLNAAVALNEERLRPPRKNDKDEDDVDDMTLPQWQAYVAAQAKIKKDLEANAVAFAGGVRVEDEKRGVSIDPDIDDQEQKEVGGGNRKKRSRAVFSASSSSSSSSSAGAKIPASRPPRPPPGAALAPVAKLAEAMIAKFSNARDKDDAAVKSTRRLQLATLLLKPNVALDQATWEATTNSLGVNLHGTPEELDLLLSFLEPAAHESVRICLKPATAAAYKSLYMQ